LRARFIRRNVSGLRWGKMRLVDVADSCILMPTWLCVQRGLLWNHKPQLQRIIIVFPAWCVFRYRNVATRTLLLTAPPPSSPVALAFSASAPIRLLPGFFVCYTLFSLSSSSYTPLSSLPIRYIFSLFSRNCNVTTKLPNTNLLPQPTQRPPEKGKARNNPTIYKS
jgi:hypothetical protein